MNDKKNVVLTDFECKENWAFLSALNESTSYEWHQEGIVSNRYHGSFIQNVWRYVLYFTFPFMVFLRRKNYANIVAWQQFLGLNLAFFFRLFHAKKNCNLLIMTFIYNHRGG